jgi:ribosomal protein S12 methylthiotransferase
VQQKVSRELTAAKAGRTIDVIVDEVDEEGAVGRSKWDAPEIDGSVFLNGAPGLRPGDIVKARVTHADEYDLWADVGERAASASRP